MSDKDIEVKLSLDDGAFVKGIESTLKKLSALDGALGGMSKEWSKTETSLKNWAKVAQSGATSSKALVTTLKSTSTALKHISSNALAASNSVTKLKRAMSNMSKPTEGFVKAQKALAELQKGGGRSVNAKVGGYLNGVGDHFSKFNEISDRLRSSTGDIDNAMKSIRSSMSILSKNTGTVNARIHALSNALKQLTPNAMVASVAMNGLKDSTAKMASTLSQYTQQQVRALSTKALAENLRSLQARTDRTEVALKNMNARLRETTKSANTAWTVFRDGVIVLGLIRHAVANLDLAFVAPFRNILRNNAELERMQALMTGLESKSLSFEEAQIKATKNVSEIFDISKNSPFDVKTITDGFIKIKTGGVEPLDGKLQALTESVAKFGGTSAHFHRAAVAIQQMYGKSVLSLEEIRQQLGEAVPNAMQVMSRSLGLTVGQFSKLVSKGVVESKEALQAAFRQMSLENIGAADRMAKTWDGLINRLKSQWVEASKVAGDAGFFASAKAQLLSISDALNSPDFINAMTTIGDVLGSFIRGTATVVQTMYEWGDVIKMVGGALIAARIAKTLSGVSSSLGAFRQNLSHNIAFLKGHQAATDKTSRSLVIYGESVLNGARNTEKATAVDGQAVSKKIQLERSTSLLTASTRGLGAALTFAGGPLTVFLTTVGLLTPKLMDWLKTQKEVYEELSNKDIAMMTRDDFEAIKEGWRDATDEAAGYQEKINKLREKLDRARDGNSRGKLDDSVLKAIESQHGRELRQYEDLQKSLLNRAIYYQDKISAYKIYSSERAGQTQASAYVRLLQDEAFKASNIYRESADKIIKEAQQIDGKAARKEHIDRENLKNEQDYRDALIAIMKKYEAKILAKQKEAEEKLTRLGSGASKDRREKLEEELANQVQALKAFQSESEGILKRFDMDRGGLNLLDGGDSGKQENDLNNYINATKASIESVNAKIVELRTNYIGGNHELAKLMSKLGTSYKGGDSKAKEEAIKLTKSLHEQSLAYKEVKDQVEKYKEAEERLLGLKRSINQAFAKRVEENPFAKDIVAAENFKRKLLEVQATMKLEAATLQGQVGKSDDGNRDAYVRRLEQVKVRLKDVQAEIDGINDKGKEAVIALLQKTADGYAQNNTSAISKASTEVEQLKVQLEEARKRLTGGNIDVGLFKAMNKAIIEAEGSLDRLKEKETTTYQKETQAIESEYLPAQEAIKNAYLENIEAVKKWQGENEALEGSHKLARERMIALERKYAVESLGSVGRLIVAWDDWTTNMQDTMADAMSGFVDTLADGLIEGELKFTDFFKNLGKMILKVQLQLMAANLASGFTNMFGVDLSGGQGSQISNASFSSKLEGPPIKFATGGIMTEQGPLALRKYANGGIAHTPQLALYGEGSMPEAYVPLPDGRTIPVTVSHNAPASTGPGNIQFNLINESGQPMQAKQKGAPRFDGKQMILDVVLDGMSRPGGFRDGMKGALR